MVLQLHINFWRGKTAPNYRENRVGRGNSTAAIKQRLYSISCHEFVSQFGLAFFLYAKNIQNYSEYRVTHASGQLNRTSDACHGSSPPTSQNGNELSGDNILWSWLIASGPSERRQHERRQLRPKRLENVVKELVRSL